MLKVNYRPLKNDDIHFVVDAWLKNYSDQESVLKMHGCKGVHRTLILACLSKYQTIIACNPEDEDQIFGFLNYFTDDTNFITNYVYVKTPFRSMGIGEKLFDCAKFPTYKEAIATHSTYVFHKFARAKKLEHFYYPHLIFKELYT